MRVKNFVLVLVSLSLVILFLGGVGAVLPSGDNCAIVPGTDTALNQAGAKNKIVMVLSGEDNAHGAVYSGGNIVTTNYYLVCGFTTGNSARVCESPASLTEDSVPKRPKNLVLRLFSDSNAHAEAPDSSSPVYSTNVCFGDFERCDWDDGNSCNGPNQVKVAGLSSFNNAHLGEYGSYVGDNKFGICCTKVVTGCTPECGAPQQRCSLTNNRIIQERACSGGSCPTLGSWTTKETCGAEEVCVNNGVPQCVNKCGVDADGDGKLLDSGEACDEGTQNGVAGSGCSLACTVTPGSVCTDDGCLTMYWSNSPTGNKITTSNFNGGSQSSIYLILKGSLIKKIVNYEIEVWESDSLSSSFINYCTGDLFCANDGIKIGSSSFKKNPDSDGILSQEWIISQDDWDKGSDFGDGNILEFFFKDVNDNQHSGILEVTDSSVPASNLCIGGTGGGVEYCVLNQCDTINRVSGTFDDQESVKVCCSVPCSTTPPTGNCGSDGDGDGKLLDSGEACDGGANCITAGETNQCTCVSSQYYSDGTGGCARDADVGCEEQTNSADCAAYTEGNIIGQPHSDSTISCPVLVDYTCQWDGSNGCQLTEDRIYEGPGYTVSSCNPLPISSKCKYDTTVEGDCDQGASNVRFSYVVNAAATTAAGGTPANCQVIPEQNRVCPQRVLLPFFTWINFLITAITISFIYFLLHLDGLLSLEKKVSQEIKETK